MMAGSLPGHSCGGSGSFALPSLLGRCYPATRVVHGPIDPAALRGNPLTGLYAGVYPALGMALNAVLRAVPR